MFLCYTSQGVDIVLKFNFTGCYFKFHKTKKAKQCLNKIVTNKLALFSMEPNHKGGTNLRF